MVRPAQNIIEITTGLDAMAQQVMQVVQTDQNFSEIWGWNMPVMTRQDFSGIIRSTSERLKSLIDVDFSDEDALALLKFPALILWSRNNVINNLPGGNAFHVYTCVRSLLDSIEVVISKYHMQDLKIEEIKDRKLLPGNMIKELMAVRTQIENAKERYLNVDNQLSIISQGSQVIDNLPGQIESATNARDVFLTASATLSDSLAMTEDARGKIEQYVASIKEIEGESKRILANIQSAHAATTSVGLGSEFEQRARSLQKSLYILSGFLVVVLSISGVISYLSA